MKTVSRVLAGGLLAMILAGAPAVAIELQSDTETATAGYFQLRWQDDDRELRLVESEDPEFAVVHTVYQGADTARLVSGKPDGTYYYRLESVDGDVSQPLVRSNSIAVAVRHHSLGRALTFFAVGAAVFAATLALVVIGERRGRAAESRP